MSPTARPIGPAVITGAIRGAIASLFPAAAVIAFNAATNYRFDVELVAVILIASLVICTSMAVADSVAVRLREPRGRRIVRLIGGGLGPALAFVPFLSPLGQELGFAPQLNGKDLLGIVVGAIGLAVGLAWTTDAYPGAPATDRLRRILRGGAIGLVLATALLTVLTMDPSVLCGTFTFGGLLLTPLLVAFWLGHLAAAPFARGVGRWIEPGTGVDLGNRVQRARQHLLRADAAWSRADRTDDEARRKAALEEAIEHARLAWDLALDEPALAGALRPSLARLFSALFRLGRLDEVATLISRVPEAGVLEAELLREKGDPAAAIARATIALEEVPFALRGRSHAYAVLALAYSDLGRRDEAAAMLTELTRVQQFVSPILDRFEVESVRRQVERLRLAGSNGSDTRRDRPDALQADARPDL